MMEGRFEIAVTRPDYSDGIEREMRHKSIAGASKLLEIGRAHV